MKKIGIIVGSTRPGRVGIQIAEHTLSKSPKSENFSYSLIDLKEINLPLLDEPYPAAMGKYQHSHTIAWANKIKEFDGFIIVTPEYNFGYSAALKNALDYLYAEWNNKRLAFIGYGYSASGSRAVMQLRQVIVNLQLKPIFKDVLINLFNNTKDGKFVSDDFIDQQITNLFTDLEKSFN